MREPRNLDSETTLLLRSLVTQNQPWAGVSSDAVWDRLQRAADQADVPGLLALRALTTTALEVHRREQFERTAVTAARRQGYALVEAERVFERLATRGVPAVVLKGASLARTVYAQPGARSFRDLDLLVVPDQIDDAVGALRELGYEHVAPPELRAVYRRHHFHYILDAPGRPRLELHWRLTRPDDLYRLEAHDLLEDSTIPAGDAAFACPHPDGQVLHATACLLRCGFTELKRLVDLDRLVAAQAAALRWPRIVALARERGLEPALRLYVELTADICGTVLDEPLRLIAPLGARAGQLTRLGAREFPLLHPRGHWYVARHLVRWILIGQGLAPLGQFVRCLDFEHERLRALHVPPRVRAVAAGKRASLALLLAAWRLELAQPFHF